MSPCEPVRINRLSSAPQLSSVCRLDPVLHPIRICDGIRKAHIAAGSDWNLFQSTMGYQGGRAVTGLGAQPSIDRSPIGLLTLCRVEWDLTWNPELKRQKVHFGADTPWDQLLRYLNSAAL